MSEMIAVAELIEHRAREHEAFVKAADMLRRIGSLEQCESEAKARVSAVIQAEAAAADQRVEAARKELAEIGQRLAAGAGTGLEALGIKGRGHE